eukprot:4315461-Prorocentrum_lima.AAC.1
MEVSAATWVSSTGWCTIQGVNHTSEGGAQRRDTKGPHQTHNPNNTTTRPQPQTQTHHHTKPTNPHRKRQ